MGGEKAQRSLGSEATKFSAERMPGQRRAGQLVYTYKCGSTQINFGEGRACQVKLITVRRQNAFEHLIRIFRFLVIQLDVVNDKTNVVYTTHDHCAKYSDTIQRDLREIPGLWPISLTGRG